MIDKAYLRQISGKILLTGDQTEQEFLRGNWMRLFAIFDTGPMYHVVDGKKIIGTLDSSFARAQKLPFVFVLGGQEWNTRKLEHELQQVVVEKNKTGKAPKWKALAGFDIPFELAQEVGHLLMNDVLLEFLDSSAEIVLQRHRNTYHRLNWDTNKWILESSFEHTTIYLWSYSGDKINRALSTLISAEISAVTDYDFMKITINLNKENPLTLGQIYACLLTLRSKSQSELEQLCEKQISPKWFSKFSECLPDTLAAKTMREKGLDVAGLSRELNKINFENLALVSGY
jgi:ATP-dependent Lhr-like helicase